MILSACKKSEINKGADDILLQIGDSILTQQAVVGQIPNGLSANDSVNLFDAIVKAIVSASGNPSGIADTAKAMTDTKISSAFTPFV